MKITDKLESRLFVGLSDERRAPVTSRPCLAVGQPCRGGMWLWNECGVQRERPVSECDHWSAWGYRFTASCTHTDSSHFHLVPTAEDTVHMEALSHDTTGSF